MVLGGVVFIVEKKGRTKIEKKNAIGEEPAGLLQTLLGAHVLQVHEGKCVCSPFHLNKQSNVIV